MNKILKNQMLVVIAIALVSTAYASCFTGEEKICVEAGGICKIFYQNGMHTGTISNPSGTVLTALPGGPGKSNVDTNGTNVDCRYTCTVQFAGGKPIIRTNIFTPRSSDVLSGDDCDYR